MVMAHTWKRLSWPQVYDRCAAPEKEASHSNSSGQCQAQCSAGGSDNFSRVQRRGHFPGPSHRTCGIGRLLRRRKAQPQRVRMTTGCSRRVQPDSPCETNISQIPRLGNMVFELFEVHERQANCVVVNNTGVPLKLVTVVHKYSDNYVVKDKWENVDAGATTRAMTVRYHTGSLTTGRDWWLVV
ncbi:hypothetical protein OEZ86_001231 [Tetradesmus obliquus]|nr:hypothetical protein OEZ86_001231 [Tetradesmus obliquus]